MKLEQSQGVEVIYAPENGLAQIAMATRKRGLLMMPNLGASDCSKRGLRACCEARRPSAVSAPEARRWHPSSWSIHVIATAAHVELVPHKWACASTAQRRTSYFDSALRVLMLRHDHPWPRVQWRDGSGTTKAHADKHITNAITAFQKSVPSAASGQRTRPLRGLTRPRCLAVSSNVAKCCLRDRGLRYPVCS